MYTLSTFFKYNLVVRMYNQLTIDRLFRRQYKIMYNNILFGQYDDTVITCMYIKRLF